MTRMLEVCRVEASIVAGEEPLPPVPVYEQLMGMMMIVVMMGVVSSVLEKTS